MGVGGWGGGAGRERTDGRIKWTGRMGYREDGWTNING